MVEGEVEHLVDRLRGVAGLRFISRAAAVASAPGWCGCCIGRGLTLGLCWESPVLAGGVGNLFSPKTTLAGRGVCRVFSAAGRGEAAAKGLSLKATEDEEQVEVLLLALLSLPSRLSRALDFKNQDLTALRGRRSCSAIMSKVSLLGLGLES